MKKLFWAISLLLGFWMNSAFGQSAPSGFSLVPAGSQVVPVTVNKMTNLVFPVALGPAIKVSRQVLAQKVSGVDNVIELKALHRNFEPTNLSVYGKDGRLYSFELRYTEDSSVLNFYIINDTLRDHPVRLSGLPVDRTSLEADAVLLTAERGFLHRGVSVEEMRLRLKGIFLRDSLLWMVFRLTNHSQVGYHPAYLHFSIEDRKRAKRTARQDIVLPPVYDGHPSAVGGDSSEVFAVGFDPFTLSTSKKLVVEVAEVNGGRTLLLALKAKSLLRARGMKE
ncbi:MAG TPA: DUF4138 domain-containing protein [Puia sp.]|nr:DUF4138 domain-containing protein [Puia sp.]